MRAVNECKGMSQQVSSPPSIDVKVKDCLGLETLEEGNTYNISVVSSKSFRGKNRYLIILARHDDSGMISNEITNERYVSNSSFEEEYENTGLTRTVNRNLVNRN